MENKKNSSNIKAEKGVTMIQKLSSLFNLRKKTNELINVSNDFDKLLDVLVEASHITEQKIKKLQRQIYFLSKQQRKRRC